MTEFVADFFFKKKMLGFVRYWFVTKKKVRDGVRESEFGSEFVINTHKLTYLTYWTCVYTFERVFDACFDVCTRIGRIFGRMHAY